MAAVLQRWHLWKGCGHPSCPRQPGWTASQHHKGMWSRLLRLQQCTSHDIPKFCTIVVPLSSPAQQNAIRHTPSCPLQESGPNTPPSAFGGESATATGCAATANQVQDSEIDPLHLHDSLLRSLPRQLPIACFTALATADFVFMHALHTGTHALL